MAGKSGSRFAYTTRQVTRKPLITLFLFLDRENALFYPQCLNVVMALSSWLSLLVGDESPQDPRLRAPELFLHLERALSLFGWLVDLLMWVSERKREV